MIRSASAVLFAACAALLWTAPAAADELPYLSRIAVERAPGHSAEFDASVRSVLHVNDPSRAARALAEVDGLAVVAHDADTVIVEFAEKPTVAGGAEDRFLQSTFVIDFDEKPVRALSEQVPAKLERNPTAAELETFVYEYIEDKTYSRAFDLASRVAATGQGDCTEHAVLLAALARANGLHARVVFGLVILDSESGLSGFGHAWAEIHDGESWQIRDATQPQTEPGLRHVRYLPVGILDNEGPGYFLSMADAIVSFPTRITGVANTE